MLAYLGRLLAFSAFVYANLKVIDAQSLSPVVGGLSATPTRPSPRGAFWNPALIGASSVDQMDSNLALLGGWMIYDRAGIDPNTNAKYESSDISAMAPNPYFSISSSLGMEEFKFGYSTYIPGGIFANFKEEGSQRYQLINGMIVPWHHQLTVVYRPSSKWSFGLSGIYSIGFLQSELSLDLNRFMEKILSSEQIPKESSVLEARARIPLSLTHSFGGAMGIYYAPSYQWSFGLAVFSPIVYHFDSVLQLDMPASVEALGPGLKALAVEDTVDMKMKAESSIPPVIHFGFSYQPFGYWTSEVFGRYAFSSWRPSLSIEIQEAPIEQAKSYKRKGVDLDDQFLLGTVQSFHLWKRWKLGLNFTYASSAIPDSQLAVNLADFDTIVSGSFLQYQWSSRWIFGIEYAHNFMLTREAKGTGTQDSGNEIFSSVSSDGVYRASSDRFALMVNYAF